MNLGKCHIGFAGGLGLVLTLVLAPSFENARTYSDAAPILVDAVPVPLPPAAPKLDIVEGSIRRNATLIATLVGLNVPTDDAQRIVKLIQPVFDLRKLRSGNTFRLVRDSDGGFKAFEYQIDEESALKVERADGNYAARVEKLDLETIETVVDVEIRQSLFRSLENVPKGELLGQAFAKIFAWDVDFNTQLQPLDRVRIVVEERLNKANGEFVKYGPIQAAELVTEGRTFRAFLFREGYYDADGKALKREFLSTPLQFEPRITSGFSPARLHPILGKVTPHLAVDYGAPTGAPVIAIGSGTVIIAGWNDGGYGNLVEIKHANGLVSGYAHLTRVAAGVRAGRSVKQGDVIGYVGQTGLATGPHLHFMILRGSVALDPRSVLKSEPAVPIQAKLQPEFRRHIEGYLGVFIERAEQAE